MLGKRKKTLMVNVIVVFIFFVFETPGFTARIVPKGTVSIIEDSKVIGEFSQQAQLPEGVLLRCEDNCDVKLDDVYMTVKPKTVFSISPMADHHDVLVQHGIVYYSLNESSRPLNFFTPAENITTGNLYMTDDELRGYVRVAGNDTEIGVLAGGSMMIEIGSDKISVFSGEKLTIPSADDGKNAIVTIKQAEAGLKKNTKYTISAIEAGEHPDHGGPGGGGPGGGDPGGGSGGGGSGGGSGGVGSGDGSSGGAPSGGKGGGVSGGGPSGGKGGDTW